MWLRIKQFFALRESKDLSEHRCETTRYEDLCQ